MSESPLAIRKEAWSGGDTRLAKSVARPLVRFLEQETASGLLLLFATACALIWANVAPDNYHSFWESGLDIVLRDTHLLEHNGHALPLHLWVNDVLMVLFFFVAGLEIKSELAVGDLSDPKVAALPAIAALGGMLIPAAIFYAVNVGGSGSHGWGVPMATDIAFAVGVLALLGPRVPYRLKLFLLTLAIADDIGAILVIAIFYSTGLSFQWLAAALAGLVVVALLKQFRVWYIPVYVIVGIFVWYCTFRSGVHATIAGVALGLIAPAKPLLGPRAFENIEDIMTGERATPASVRNANWKMKESVSITSRLITLLTPWTGFIIVPLFALANAGVLLSGDVLSNAVSNRVMWGVILGLVIAGAAAFLSDLDRWMPSVAFWSDIDTKPGPHAYLEGLLKEMYDSDEFHETLDGLKSPEADVLRAQVLQVWTSLNPAPTPRTQRVWDLGGQPESNLTYPARVIARKHWKIGAETAKQVIRAWQKTECRSYLPGSYCPVFDGHRGFALRRFCWSAARRKEVGHLDQAPTALQYQHRLATGPASRKSPRYGQNASAPIRGGRSPRAARPNTATTLRAS